jgi:hypothetical protein
MNLPKKYSELTPLQKKDVREEYIKLQNNKCMFCNEKFTNQPPDGIKSLKIDWSLFPPGFLKNPIHLQHNHDTDLTEGAVHAYCNAVMWQYEGR